MSWVLHRDGTLVEHGRDGWPVDEDDGSDVWSDDEHEADR